MHTQVRRTGVLAVKKGMMQLWDSWGVRMPVTVLQVRPTPALAPHARSFRQTQGRQCAYTFANAHVHTQPASVCACLTGRVGARSWITCA
jgi:ribosomal protein L3